MNETLYPATDALDLARSLLAIATEACDAGTMSGQLADSLQLAAEALAADLAEWRSQQADALPARTNMAINWALIDLDAVAQFSKLVACIHSTDACAVRLLTIIKHTTDRPTQNLATSGIRITLLPAMP
jgi:hypothetical protein